MKTYTGKQITELLNNEGADLNLRTVRYYTQIEIVPPLELVGNKRVYTDQHVHYFRAALTLSKAGKSLASIQETLRSMSVEEVKSIGAQLPLYQSKQIQNQEMHQVNEDVFVAMNRKLSADVRQKVIESVTQILKEHSSHD
ncbi:MerR family transcriptional regulator [Priestia aryabhattai]|uniref:MerR family transcriptional regulator n=1 Tax=Priestia TaxID=2800373 RepID=UPI002D7FEDE4|nr:MerR family transcriptional regulator [Priestia megaterium]MEB4857558.1 MerR family transcriptional regulator [Priestia megaterium]